MLFYKIAALLLFIADFPHFHSFFIFFPVRVSASVSHTAGVGYRERQPWPEAPLIVSAVLSLYLRKKIFLSNVAGAKCATVKEKERELLAVRQVVKIPLLP